MIRILIADDHALLRERFRQLLALLPGVRVDGEAETEAQMLQAIKGGDVDLLLLDISLYQASGAELIRQVRALRETLPILVISMHNEPQVACQALLAQNAQAQAVQQNTLALLNQRTTQIDALRGQISATTDPKSIAELQARLEAEEAQVANDQAKVALTNAMLASNQQAASQAQAERVDALMATNKTSVLDNFSFTALGTSPAVQTAAVDQ